MLATASSAVIARKTAKSGQIGVGHGGHKATQCYATGTVLQYNKGQFGANWDCMRGWMYLLHKGGGALWAWHARQMPCGSLEMQVEVI
jgi:hypothetical protein